MTRLFDTGAKKPRRGSTRALVPVKPGTCPDCGSELDTHSSAQPALIRHGGYGETSVTTSVGCRCGWTMELGVTSENPRKSP